MKKTIFALALILIVAPVFGRPASEATRKLNEIRKGRPWIAATTKLVEQNGQMVLSDSTDYAFENDPAVIGSWQVVDFVAKTGDFKPGVTSWQGEAFLKSLTFAPDGQVQLTATSGTGSTKWTRGHVLFDEGGVGTDATYQIVSLGGKEYLFYQWKSGDYSLRYDQPQYYVLVKGTAEEAAASRASAPPVREADIKYVTKLSQGNALQIVERPQAADFGRGTMSSLPSYSPGSSDVWQVDVRGSDLTRLDLSRRLSDLMHADFDSVTKWPRKLPRGFDPAVLMELGKNPGLGLRALHAAGHTGKGVGIAIIDQALLTEHVEYRDQLRMYEEIHWPTGGEAQMHAPAVASIAVGKSTGVAPEADLYFIANWMGITTTSGQFQYELSTLAQSIDRIVAVNESLARGKRIRVISISLGINPSMKGYELVKASIAKALQKDIYVAFVGSDPFMGMGRDPLKNADDFTAYGPGEFWRSNSGAGAGQIMIPMDNRCTASPTGASDYVFYSQGGMSWTVPWVAGLYALACQELPDMTPRAFWDAAGRTARTASFGRIIDPARLLDALTR